jgi:hypothetical protein
MLINIISGSTHTSGKRNLAEKESTQQSPTTQKIKVKLPFPKRKHELSPYEEEIAS